MTMSKTRLFILTGLSVLLRVASFQVNRPTARCGNSLQASRSEDENRRNTLNWTDLPRSRSSPTELSNTIEIGIGRVAMVGFVGLFAGEIVSQQTFEQQIIAAVSLFGGN